MILAIIITITRALVKNLTIARALAITITITENLVNKRVILTLISYKYN